MRTSLLVLSLAALSGCGSDPTTAPADSGAPADTSVPQDAPGDVPGDAPSDAPGDAPGDAGVTCSGPEPTTLTQVRTDRGVVQGALERGAWHWLGIPYAEPPTGARRWRPTEPLARCWEGVRMATEWASACPQIPQQQGQPFNPDAPMEGQEDCLTLNVWTPEGAPRTGALPVMVFIHGGGNQVGSAGELTQTGARLFDGSRLSARGGVVVVTLQYRLGPLGFLAHAALAAEPGNVAGNYGLMDQTEALRWVQRNIRAFGGDPARVMLFGESAGAVNTCMQVGSPAAAGLFSRALIQSGSCVSARPLTQRTPEGDRYATNARCAGVPDVPGCLRALGVQAALRAGASPVSVSGLEGSSSFAWGPTVDGRVLPEVPLARIAAGRHHHVALVVGSNTDETALAVPTGVTLESYRAALVTAFGATAGAGLAERYPVARYGTPRGALVQATTDARFGCQARLTARAFAQGQRDAPVYRYLYAQPMESAGAVVRALGAFHGLELAFVFQGLDQRAAPSTPAELATERALLGYWTRFAATGDPNGSGAPAWSRYTAGEPLLRLAGEPMEERGWRGAECDYVDGVSGTAIPAP